MPLPFFLYFASSIKDTVILFNDSEPIPIPVTATLLGPESPFSSIPILWIYILLNILTQFACVRAIFYLTTEISSLSVTLLLTVRKFVSLALSVVLFNNQFTNQHWAGASLVLLGTLIYSEVLPFEALFTSKKSKDKSE